MSLEVIKREQPVQGYRRVRLHKGEIRSLNHGLPVPLLGQAKCTRVNVSYLADGPPVPHLPPHEKCSCGYYAYKPGVKLLDGEYMERSYRQGLVANVFCDCEPPTTLDEWGRRIYYVEPGYDYEMWVEVFLFGKVIEHENGYRGQYQQIISARMGKDQKYRSLIEDVANSHNLPLVIVDDSHFHRSLESDSKRVVELMRTGHWTLNQARALATGILPVIPATVKLGAEHQKAADTLSKAADHIAKTMGPIV